MISSCSSDILVKHIRRFIIYLKNNTYIRLNLVESELTVCQCVCAVCYINPTHTHTHTYTQTDGWTSQITAQDPQGSFLWIYFISLLKMRDEEIIQISLV